uniref:Uncharacterized protein n=1 Tax=Meloidogyne incognita TaxID=6306 RepID=A0A914KJX2_MELIC
MEDKLGNPKLMEKSNLAVKRERQEEDNEHDEVRENGQPAVAVETNSSSTAVLRNKLDMLRQEEGALLSLLSRLRSHQRTLQLEQNKLNEIYENKIKERENSEAWNFKVFVELLFLFCFKFINRLILLMFIFLS